MISSFAWLDYSERQRQQMLDTIDAFSDQDTRDELGIGTVRDAFSELLFPGTSTIQTRAKYFLFVPWIYLDLERRRVPSARIGDRARREEVKLMDALASSEDTEGLIGKQARESLQRLPSSVYWTGLGRWDIRLFPGSRGQYHRSLDGYYASIAFNEQRDEGQATARTVSRNWHAGLPPAPEGFPDEASFALTKQEANYLREQVMTHAPGTLLAFLVDHSRPFEEVDFPWQHPQFGEFPDHSREQLGHARNFSEVIHGAALLYNLMLAELDEAEGWVEDYTARLMEWAGQLEARRRWLADWDRGDFWNAVRSRGAHIPLRIQRFVDRWLDLALSPGTAGAIASNEAARELIRERERSLKGERARLFSRRALEMWNGEAGTARLDYRWSVARTIVLDIRKGLSEEEAIHATST